MGWGMRVWGGLGVCSCLRRNDGMGRRNDGRRVRVWGGGWGVLGRGGCGRPCGLRAAGYGGEDVHVAVGGDLGFEAV